MNARRGYRAMSTAARRGLYHVTGRNATSGLLDVWFEDCRAGLVAFCLEVPVSIYRTQTGLSHAGQVSPTSDAACAYTRLHGWGLRDGASAQRVPSPPMLQS